MKIADLHAHNASQREALWACRFHFLFSQFQPLIFDNLTLCQFNLSFQRLKKGLYVVTLDMYINPQYTVCCFVYSWVRKQCCTLSFGPPKIILGPLWGLDPQFDKRWGVCLAAVCTRTPFPLAQHHTTPHHTAHLCQVFHYKDLGRVVWKWY